MRAVTVTFADGRRQTWNECEVEEVCHDSGPVLCYVLTGRGWKATLNADHVAAVEEIE